MRVDRLTGLGPPVVLGLGLGVFFDGILLHQVLQWHHLVSSRVPADDLDGLQANTLADGLFHAAGYLLLAVGLAWGWRRRGEVPRRPGRAVLGALLVGFGVWHVIDQLVSHLLLELHHIRPGPHEQLYDWGFTAVGVAVGLVGWRLLRQGLRSGHAAGR